MRTHTQPQIKQEPQADATPSPFSLSTRSNTTPAPAAEAPDLAMQLQRAEVLGHSFSRVTVQANGLKPRDPGRRLPDPLQHKMEAAFGQDFSSVRLHEDGNAESIGASAYTRGEHVHFRPGAYQPHSPSGQSLLGHELTHVVQQRAGRVALPQGKGLPINADGGLESEADAMGRRAAAGQSAVVRGVSTGVQRKAVVGGGGVVQREGTEKMKRREKKGIVRRGGSSKRQHDSLPKDVRREAHGFKKAEGMGAADQIEASEYDEIRQRAAETEQFGRKARARNEEDKGRRRREREAKSEKKMGKRETVRAKAEKLSTKELQTRISGGHNLKKLYGAILRDRELESSSSDDESVSDSADTTGSLDRREDEDDPPGDSAITTV